MPKEYREDKDLQKALNDILADDSFNELDPLRNSHAQICAIYVTHLNKEKERVKGKGDPAVVKKVGVPFDLFTSYTHLVIVDEAAFEEAEGQEQFALLHHALMQIEVHVDEKGNETFKKRLPNVHVFSDTIKRFGVYSDGSQVMTELLSRTSGGPAPAQRKARPARAQAQEEPAEEAPEEAPEEEEQPA